MSEAGTRARMENDSNWDWKAAMSSSHYGNKSDSESGYDSNHCSVLCGIVLVSFTTRNSGASEISSINILHLEQNFHFTLEKQTIIDYNKINSILFKMYLLLIAVIFIFILNSCKFMYSKKQDLLICRSDYSYNTQLFITHSTRTRMMEHLALCVWTYFTFLLLVCSVSVID